MRHLRPLSRSQFCLYYDLQTCSGSKRARIDSVSTGSWDLEPELSQNHSFCKKTIDTMGPGEHLCLVIQCSCGFQGSDSYIFIVANLLKGQTLHNLHWTEFNWTKNNLWTRQSSNKKRFKQFQHTMWSGSINEHHKKVEHTLNLQVCVLPHLNQLVAWCWLKLNCWNWLRLGYLLENPTPKVFSQIRLWVVFLYIYIIDLFYFWCFLQSY